MRTAPCHFVMRWIFYVALPRLWRSSGLEVTFDACGSNLARGRIVLPASEEEPATVEVGPCGFGSLNNTLDEGLLKRLLVEAVGLSKVQGFVKIGNDPAEYLSAFASAVTSSLAKSCTQARDAGALSCIDCPEAPKLGKPTGERQDHEQVSEERAMLEGLAAACGLIEGADHVELANRTNWLREHENELEWDDPQRTIDRRKCLLEGDFHGYRCHTFTYGSTYFPSWLRVMRFPAVAAALETIKRDGGEVVVLGSSLGWQTLWTALTFGIRTVGYELMTHRVKGAKLATEGLPEGLIEFRKKDASDADLSKARILYLTDLLWEDFLCGSVAYHVRQSLMKEGAHKDVVIVSNNTAHGLKPDSSILEKLRCL